MDRCDSVTKEIAKYVRNRGLKIDAIAGGTGISKNILETAICREKRKLRVDEFLTICCYLNKDPHEFGS